MNNQQEDRRMGRIKAKVAPRRSTTATDKTLSKTSLRNRKKTTREETEKTVKITMKKDRNEVEDLRGRTNQWRMTSRR